VKQKVKSTTEQVKQKLDDAWAPLRDDHPRVKRIQEALKSQGHDPGPIDGLFGPRTEEALRSYQAAQNVRTVNDTLTKLGVSQ
jgi:peptidoglycan hydrolase-like protein with peptidoglycan-binding domain